MARLSDSSGATGEDNFPRRCGMDQRQPFARQIHCGLLSQPNAWLYLDALPNFSVK
jgi:hypothetical protein